MPFFDELGRRITNVGHTVAESTKGISESSRITSAVSAEQKNLTGYYAQLGKAYLAKYKDSIDPEFLSITQQIEESKVKLDNFQQQMRDTRGVIICEKCGAEIPKGNAFCSACGTRVTQHGLGEKDSVAETKVCPSCGVEVNRNSKFCTNCGEKLE